MKNIHGEFDMHAVRDQLTHNHPAISQEITDNQLSAILAVLAERKELEITRE